jgi:alkanesulfonate monooxygenase SsuD/methylene tetrahydromethanopterin reductase-like flavin-dependent oxidoreductase (luciferase family)
VSARVEAVLPFWLDRPDEEALDIARTVSDVALDALWIGEMVTYDAFALATAIGHRVPGLPLRLGPLAVGVRSPVTLALGVSSIASLTGTRVDIALGASSPMIVAGWHDRERRSSACARYSPASAAITTAARFAVTVSGCVGLGPRPVLRSGLSGPRSPEWRPGMPTRSFSILFHPNG